MSQKTNPIALRLQKSNKHFESCWYSDFFYDQVLSEEIQQSTYIEGLLYQAGRTKTVLSVISQYKRYLTFLFFLDIRAERHKREYSLKLSREPADNVFLPRTKFPKNKNSIPALDGLLFNQAQESLCTKSQKQEERYNCLIEEVTKQRESGVTQNGVLEYVSDYAIKGSSLELLSLSGVHSTKSRNRERNHPYNSIVNPGLKHKILARVNTSNKDSNDKFTKGEVGIAFDEDFYKSSKGFLVFSMLSFALARAIPKVQEESLIKDTALLTSTKETLARLQPRLGFNLSRGKKVSFLANQVSSNPLKGKSLQSLVEKVKIPRNSVSLKNRAIKEFNSISLEPSNVNLFPVQQAGDDNLFRRLIIDQHSKSTQNRLSFFLVKTLEKQLAHTNIFPLLHAKYSLTLRENPHVEMPSTKPRKAAVWNSTSLEPSYGKLSTVKAQNIVTAPLLALVCNRGIHQLGTPQLQRTQQSIFRYFESSNSMLINLRDKADFIKKNNDTNLVQQEWQNKSLGLARHVELFLNICSGNWGYHSIYPVRAQSPFQSAGFLLESVAYLLQRKSSFRQIKDDIFRDLHQYPLIKGVRLSCAGRLGGRSKKAQKAKTQSAQWGETSLTVFSSRLAFASKGINTQYGKVGIKLWLCYKS